MTGGRGIVLDTNILLRAILGSRVRTLLKKYEDRVRFYTPDLCFQEAEKYLPVMSRRRAIEPELGPSALTQLAPLV